MDLFGKLQGWSNTIPCIFRGKLTTLHAIFGSRRKTWNSISSAEPPEPTLPSRHGQGTKRRVCGEDGRIRSSSERLD